MSDCRGSNEEGGSQKREATAYDEPRINGLAEAAGNSIVSLL